MRGIIGDIGHLAIIIAFCASIASGIAFVISSRTINSKEASSWKSIGRIAFYIHTITSVSIAGLLILLLYNRYYEYHYAWSHSSNNLSIYYLIACLWEGQEGSFLIWIVWQSIIGCILIKLSRWWESYSMVIISLSQAFLLSMILGIELGDIFIGSDPFILLKNVSNDPVYNLNPSYIPEDGKGLNPLLQNYWMIIHPPVLFLGFALTIVPFAIIIAGLWRNKYLESLGPALLSANIAILILGSGIVMGAFWAYETLNFGGYWNWDPVENAVYVPWLTLIASIHMLILAKKNPKFLIISLLLPSITFLLILYATFLTRSGILGVTSVHSFTNLGLSEQLVTYILVFLILITISFSWSWRKLNSYILSKSSKKNISIDFSMLLGSLCLIIAAFQVLLPTSIPLYNYILSTIKIQSNIAPPTDTLIFYSNWQLAFAILITILSTSLQLLWWKNTKQKISFKEVILVPLVLSQIISGLIIIQFNIVKWHYILLLLACSYSIVGNLQVILQLKKTKLSGGPIAHIGIAILLIGVLISSAYETTSSINTTGRIYSKKFTEDMNRKNVLLYRNEPMPMDKYLLTYKGKRARAKNIPFYIDLEELISIPDNYYQFITMNDIILKDKSYASKGDTIEVESENIYYEIVYQELEGEKFILYPRVQYNSSMGLLSSPDIKKFIGKDLYTHISSIPDPEEPIEWSSPQDYNLKLNDTFLLNDYNIVFNSIKTINPLEELGMQENDIVIEADLSVHSKEKVYSAKPKYIIRDSLVTNRSSVISALGVKITMKEILAKNKTITFTIQQSQKDWIILKALEKPWINLVWLGSITLSIGFALSIYRYVAKPKT